MFRHSKPSSLIAITASVFALNACVMPPPNQNYSLGQGYNQPSGSLPPAAESACFNRFSEPGYQRIKQVSPLKPGYWEVIILGKNGRQVACTVDQNGVISDWVNM